MHCRTCAAPLPENARFCPACGAPVEATSPSEERKVATVLFADLVASTELGEQDPERTRALLERFYDAMAAEVVRAGGTVEKFAGDAVMAAFGAPAALEDHAERALHAALAMRRRLTELFNERLRLRIGVETGEVVVGRPREGSSFVTGDAVNVCARLEQNAAPGEILVGERAARAARGAFEFDEPSVIEAKGKRDGVACRRLVRALSLMRPRGVSGLRRVFVGREAELELLQATYRRAVEQGEPHLVTIVGEPGVGKSRLVRELWEWLGGQPEHPVRRTGRCLSYGQGITYWPLAEVLKEQFGLLETDPAAAVAERLGERAILGLMLGLDVAGGLHPLAARDRLHESWLEFVGEFARERPTVLLVEDLHWAELPLVELLERTVREVRGPVLVLATARPELEWRGGGRNSTTLWLEPLAAAEASRMVEELLAAELPEQLRRVVVEGAEGNPFFVEELTGALIDRGVLARTDGRWEVRQLPTDFAVPDSLQGALAARIDLLAPPEKAALQAAAVIGRVFWTTPVRELIEFDAPDFELLEERDFIRRRPGSSMAGEREYAIKHALTREVAYATLPKAKRARMHAGFARWLEALGEREEHAPLLAHHYAEAARPEDADLGWAGEEDQLDRLRRRAVRWLSRAAELARGRYELAEAIALLERALELEPTPEETSRLWREIGLAHALRYDGEPFWTAMQRSLELCTDRAACGESYSLLAFQTSIRSGMWKRRPDSERVDGWLARALELSEPETPARARALIARAYLHPETGREAAREASRAAERIGDVELRSYAWMARAAVAFYALEFGEAAEWALRRFDLAGEITDPDHLVELRETALPAVAALARFGEVRRLADEHVELSAGLSPHHRLHGVALLVQAEELVGGWDELVGLEARVEQAVAENADTPCVHNARCLLLCSAARIYTGADDRARELELAADELGMEGHEVALGAPRIRIALGREDLDKVSGLVESKPTFRYVFALPNFAARLDGLAALRDRDRVEQEAPACLHPGTYLEPFALRALGAVREDEELLARALNRFEALGLAGHAAETRALLSI